MKTIVLLVIIHAVIVYFIFHRFIGFPLEFVTNPMAIVLSLAFTAITRIYWMSSTGKIKKR